MMRRNDPRIRQTWNQFTGTVESANESAQANIFSFSHNYLSPCFSSVNNCVGDCVGPCFPSRDQRLRRNRGRSRGRAELNFDFYDDWEDEDAGAGLLGWENDELDRLLASSTGGEAESSGRPRAMSYGARKDKDGKVAGAARKTAVPPHDGGVDPTIIPNTSIFGFLGRLPWKLGGKGLRYKPSAADLQENPGGVRRDAHEREPLIEDSDEGTAHDEQRKQGRTRSGTAGSGNTMDSYSSRGDLFPSDDEDDAIPLDDEFAMVLERRNTGSFAPGADDQSGGRTSRSGKQRPGVGGRVSTRTTNSSRRSGKRAREGSTVSFPELEDETPPQSQPQIGILDDAAVPSIADLNKEEERIRHEEEAEVQRKRDAALKLALKRGLSVSEGSEASSKEVKPQQDQRNSPREEDTAGDEISRPLTAINYELKEPSSSELPQSIASTTSIPSPATQPEGIEMGSNPNPNSNFVPAQLPFFSHGGDDDDGNDYEDNDDHDDVTKLAPKEARSP
ncbi:MAG: hypothetical protein M1819_002738 [Sarea resinae]|nr:MAG: hypothetical protein M1819_002738 [Sarea resinae]